MHNEIVSSFTSWRMFWLLPAWGNYEYSHYKYSHMDFSFLLSKYLGVGLLRGKETLCVAAWETDKTVFRSGCMSLHSHQQWMKVPVALHPDQSLILFCFHFSHSNRYVAISHFGVICISLSLVMLMIFSYGYLPSDSLVKWLFNSFAPFEKLDYMFSNLSFQSSFNILESPLSDMFLQIFSPGLWLVFFIFFAVPFAVQKFFILVKSTFSFLERAFGVMSKHFLPNPRSGRFSSTSF